MRKFEVSVALVVGALALPALALADTATIDSVTDAGGGRIAVNYTVTSTSTESGYGGWYAYAATDHETRSCNTSWANYLFDVLPLQDGPGTIKRSATFLVFFPRKSRICIYLNNSSGERAIATGIYDMPAGYGMKRSTGYNCSHFARYSAQDYFWLYPDDPSDLDADDDGAACEHNDGPAPGPPIPAEPAPTPSATPSPSPTPTPQPGEEPEPSRPRGLATLTERKARAALRTVFFVRVGMPFRDGYAYRHDCTRRSRLRFKCRAEWVWGDLSYKASIMIFRARRKATLHTPAGARTGYDGRLRIIDHYCYAVGQSRCVRTRRLRGSL